MPIELIVLIAALIVTFLVFTWLIKVVKATIQTALTIALLVLILQIVFGIGPNQVWQKIIELPQLIWQQPNQ
ncbi:hypothetical protein IQ264_23650 [Phormidium sp. LEGE 05292]|uniref:hypothetical protein n=1 Tax=[Phormidium] sp. LEGE 05292 TaxID=767427 RepID=UPI00188197B9|nr:hypothetical protein [Phormidium sp. LEGE 05292]MBE9228420.1 hypothetical protein [Phormidium sp. LEGE 05292]